MRFNLKKILSQAERQGWRIVQGNHVKLYPRNKQYSVIVIARSPGDHRAETNALHQLRKAGLEV